MLVIAISHLPRAFIAVDSARTITEWVFRLELKFDVFDERSLDTKKCPHIIGGFPKI